MPDLQPRILLFFLLLLFIGISFWTGGDLLTKQLLTFSYRTLDKLQVETIPKVLLKLDFTVIDLKVDPEDKFTQIEIITANSPLKRLELEIPNSKFSEVAIAQELGLYPRVKQLKINQRVNLQVPLNLLAIKATINKDKKNSFVEVTTTNHSLKRLDFILPTHELIQVEGMTAQLLGMSIDNIRKLISYQLIN